MTTFCRTLCRFVRNLRSSKEGWVPAANLLSLISESKSSQSLSSSGMFPHCYLPPFGGFWELLSIQPLWLCACPADGSVSGNVSTSSSCSETYTSYSDIKPWPSVTPAAHLQLDFSTSWNSPRLLRCHHKPKLVRFSFSGSCSIYAISSIIFKSIWSSQTWIMEEAGNKHVKVTLWQRGDPFVSPCWLCSVKTLDCAKRELSAPSSTAADRRGTLPQRGTLRELVFHKIGKL